jgi:hypothetical protein
MAETEITVRDMFRYMTESSESDDENDDSNTKVVDLARTQ